jgi:hypothetical protein
MVHTKELLFYPPVIKDHFAEFEPAARGFSPCQDVWKPSKEFLRDVEKRENRLKKKRKYCLCVYPAGVYANVASTLAKASRSLVQNNETRRNADISKSPAPAFLKEPVFIWTWATWHIDHMKMWNYGQQCGFAFPPIHLFWGAQPQKQTQYYLRIMELRHELEGRFCRGEVRLRTGEWHSILGETYWKRDAVPKLEERYQPEIDPAYDPEDPYCYGGKLFFGEDVHRQINLGERVVETKMDCGC